MSTYKYNDKMMVVYTRMEEDVKSFKFPYNDNTFSEMWKQMQDFIDTAIAIGYEVAYNGPFEAMEE